MTITPPPAIPEPTAEDRKCKRCNGNGRIEMLEHCPLCKGTGMTIPEPTDADRRLPPIEKIYRECEGCSGYGVMQSLIRLLHASQREAERLRKEVERVSDIIPGNFFPGQTVSHRVQILVDSREVVTEERDALRAKCAALEKAGDDLADVHCEDCSYYADCDYLLPQGIRFE